MWHFPSLLPCGATTAGNSMPASPGGHGLPLASLPPLALLVPCGLPRIEACGVATQACFASGWLATLATLTERLTPARRTRGAFNCRARPHWICQYRVNSFLIILHFAKQNATIVKTNIDKQKTTTPINNYTKHL